MKLDTLIKDLGCHAYFYGGSATLTKYWQTKKKTKTVIGTRRR